MDRELTIQTVHSHSLPSEGAPKLLPYDVYMLALDTALLPMKQQNAAITSSGGRLNLYPPTIVELVDS
jgi:hypothetical protein